MSEGTWEKLSLVAVKGAQHDSPERQPHPKCLKGTREVLLNHICESLFSQGRNQIIWLHGTAGVGKSAVAFTVAEKMRGLKVKEGSREKRLAGTFFFSRKHTKRRTTAYFFATLVHQLANNFPSIKNDVRKTILDNPALLDSDTPLRDQMEALFLQPLQKLRLRLRGCPPLIFVIDALDECISESLDGDASKSELANLISLLGEALRDPELPVTHILLTSRSEEHICIAMYTAEMQPLLCEIPSKTSGESVAATISLDGMDVDSDICVFLRHSFANLGTRHPDFPQPSEDQLAQLASRAGRRFIVASTMMKFIDDQQDDPRDRLQLMLGLTSKLLPGTEVYKFYDCILSTCADPKLAYLHLSVVASLADPLPMSQISKLLGPVQGKDVERVLVQLRSVIGVPSMDSNLPVNIYHSSIRDYVSDPSNSNLPDLQCIAPPHSLLARACFSLMMHDIPESTPLLDALLELTKHSKAVESGNPMELDRTLDFIVEPPAPMQVLTILLWLRGYRSSELRFWLETKDGYAWLQSGNVIEWVATRHGKDWLTTDDGKDWLTTRRGKQWLRTPGAQDWLQTQGGKDWLQAQGGNVYLQAPSAGHQLPMPDRPEHDSLLYTSNINISNISRLLQTSDDPLDPPSDDSLDPPSPTSSSEADWLYTTGEGDPLQATGGRDWLQAPGGKNLLQWLDTKVGGYWLLGRHGQGWLQTQEAEDWLQSQRGRNWLQAQGQTHIQGSREWLRTQHGKEWLRTQRGREWLRTQKGREWLQSQGGSNWLQILGGKNWLQTADVQEWLKTQGGKEWLQTQGGNDWLQTPGGKNWLQTTDVQEWLQTQKGNFWLENQGGNDWLQTRGGKDWLQTSGAREWLQTQGGKVWLQTTSGQHWLQTPDGHAWLQTPGGCDWLQSQRGREWLKTQGGKGWLQTQGGENWLQTLGVRDWLQTLGGKDWLQAQEGRNWLRRQEGKDWLKTEAGRLWLETHGGQKWLETEGMQQWLQTLGGKYWLQTQGGRGWLTTRAGREWLKTQAGRLWLQTEGGFTWLRTMGGQDWLHTPQGQRWRFTTPMMTMASFWATLEAIKKYTIAPDMHLHPAFQVIQQFKNLPDFLMFPVFVALRHQDHSPATSPYGRLPPDMEIIHAMKVFSSFAYKAREESQSASDALNYACQNWVSHLSRAPNPWDERLSRIFQSFWDRNLLSWLVRQWCKGLRSCLTILSEAEKLALGNIFKHQAYLHDESEAISM